LAYKLEGYIYVHFFQLKVLKIRMNHILLHLELQWDLQISDGKDVRAFMRAT